MRSFLPRALGALLLLPALARPASAVPVVYKVDADHSGVAFSIRHFVSNVSGKFRDFDGVIRYDAEKPEASSVALTVRAASIDTTNNDRDEHLRSKDFFEVAKYPTLSFTSTQVAAKDAKTLEVTGTFTMHGVTRQITFPVQLLGTMKAPQGEKAGFSAAFTLNRKEYGINWNNLLDSGPVLGDEVRITIEIEGDRRRSARSKRVTKASRHRVSKSVAVSRIQAAFPVHVAAFPSRSRFALGRVLAFSPGNAAIQTGKGFRFSGIDRFYQRSAPFPAGNAQPTPGKAPRRRENAALRQKKRAVP